MRRSRVVHGSAGNGVEADSPDGFEDVCLAPWSLVKMSGWVDLSHGAQCVSKSGPYSQYSGGIPHAEQYKGLCGVVIDMDVALMVVVDRCAGSACSVMCPAVCVLQADIYFFIRVE